MAIFKIKMVKQQGDDPRIKGSVQVADSRGDSGPVLDVKDEEVTVSVEPGGRAVLMEVGVPIVYDREQASARQETPEETAEREAAEKKAKEGESKDTKKPFQEGGGPAKAKDFGPGGSKDDEEGHKGKK